MLMRWLLALLLAANLAFFAWSQGLFGDLLPAAQEAREPERLQRQVQPDLIRLGEVQLRVLEPGGTPAAPAAGSPAAEAAAPAAPAAPPPAAPASPAVLAAAAPGTVCLEAGFFSQAELARLEPLLQRNLPAGSWRAQGSERPAGYVVYSGRYPNREALQRRQEELRELRVEYIEMRSPPELEMGLSLGRFRQRENAERHVEDLERRGVRNVRVVPVGPPITVYRVQLPAADAVQRQGLEQISPRALGGREFHACAAPAPASPAR